MKYETSGMRRVTADGMKKAAEMFAARIARRDYGRRGEVRTLNLNSWSQDGKLGEFQAFVGMPGRGINRGTTTGRNVSFTVRAVVELD